MTPCSVKNELFGGVHCKGIILVAILKKVGSDRLKISLDTKKIW